MATQATHSSSHVKLCAFPPMSTPVLASMHTLMYKYVVFSSQSIAELAKATHSLSSSFESGVAFDASESFAREACAIQSMLSDRPFSLSSHQFAVLLMSYLALPDCPATSFIPSLLRKRFGIDDVKLPIWVSDV